jgi:ribosomal protein S18 acetylase RimI-like enzyme
MDAISVERAGPDDAAQLQALQRAAYRREAELYSDETIPPLTESLAAIEEVFTRAVILKAVADGRIVGAVRGEAAGEICHIGRLAVHPDCQGRGLGARLMQQIEEAFPEVSRYALFTGHKSLGNLRLYARLGYGQVRREEVHAGLELVYLEKANPRLA